MSAQRFLGLNRTLGSVRATSFGDREIRVGSTSRHSSPSGPCQQRGLWPEAIQTRFQDGGYGRGLVCEVLVQTLGGNCRTYCEDNGGVCMHAWDNAGSNTDASEEDSRLRRIRAVSPALLRRPDRP